MRILITGSRNWTDFRAIHVLIGQKWEALPVGGTLYVRHGANPNGADSIAQTVALWNSSIGVVNEPYPADWEKYGKAAGMIRNAEMIADNGVDEVHAFPLKESRGTAGMMNIAANNGIPVYNHGWPGIHVDKPEMVIQVRKSIGE